MHPAGPWTFPPHPIRGVRARHVRQTGCPGDYADVTVDFEPGETGFAFEVADGALPEDHDDREALSGFCTALAAGMREELADRGTEAALAVKVVIRSLRVHEVDSSDRSFRKAGHLAIRQALDEAM